ncbi:MAG: tetratricopeptide repeat protein [Aphanizomenon gracile PMC627.10]|nr:tetratricopeptide repeat protein [Aphanizomenon gracile PMC627.10]
MQIKAKTAILYVACGQSVGLVNYVAEIVNQLDPSLFDSIRNFVKELGEEMTPNLEISRQFHNHDKNCSMALIFITAMSYVRKENYDKAIEILESMDQESDHSLKSFIYWALAECYECKEDYKKANEYYHKFKVGDYHLSNTLYIFWRDWGWCQKLDSKYEQSLNYYQNALDIINEIQNFKYKASCLFSIGRVYQNWEKYEQAINYYEQSRELYQQLGKEKNVANMWYWIADCYREWGKYEQAISYYEQSRELYQQLDKEKDVADSWYWMAVCYKEWGKYQQAVDCENQDLAIRQQLDDQDRIALAYYQLGRIYQGWGKYEQAISYYEQSRELYQQLGKEKNVANLWYNLAVCYREWGKYQQAVDCENQDLAIRQQLNDQDRIALAYFRLGWIYQGWGKYEQAISLPRTKSGNFMNETIR